MKKKSKTKPAAVSRTFQVWPGGDRTTQEVVADAFTIVEGRLILSHDGQVRAAFNTWEWFRAI